MKRKTILFIEEKELGEDFNEWRTLINYEGLDEVFKLMDIAAKLDECPSTKMDLSSWMAIGMIAHKDANRLAQHFTT